VSYKNPDEEQVKSKKWDDLLRVAADLFWEKGYSKATTREIASRLGIGKATLYYHMPSKEYLLVELSLDSLRHMLDAAETVAESPLSGIKKIEHLIRVHVETMLKDKNKHATMLTEMRSLSYANRLRVLELRDRYQRVVEDVIDQAQREGYISLDIPSKYIALALLNLLNWTIFWYHDGGELEPQQLANIFCQIFIEGVGRKE
jgi:AcrR family transcriptional regulator